MSFLMDALQKQQNKAGLSDQQQVFAEDSADERRKQKFKLILISVFSLLLTFIAGFYLARALILPEQDNRHSLVADKDKSAEDRTRSEQLTDPVGVISKASDESQSSKVIENTLVEKQEQAEPVKVTAMTLSSLAMPTKQQEPIKTEQDPAKNTELKTIPHQRNQTNQGSYSHQQAEQSETMDKAVTQNIAKQADFETIETEELASESESSVSDDLLALFNAAVKETENLPDGEIADPVDTVIPRLTELSSNFQAQIPELDFQTHIYSSDAKQGWVKVNGRVVREGQNIAQGVVLDKITPQAVILKYQGQAFSLPALSTW